MFYYIDTHTHLYDAAFAGEGDSAVARAVEAGVAKLIFPDISEPTREAMFSLAERHPGTAFPCLGLHPTDLTKDWEAEIEQMLSWKDRDICAIGEIGMDLYWSKELVSEQEAAFGRQLEIAHEMDLPVIIHSRDATDRILDVLRRHRHLDLRGSFHAFSGSIETYREIQKLGDFYVGIGGVLTFKKASIAETVKEIPLGRILLETDSPYLTPVPHRGERNESAYIPHIAAFLARQKGISAEEVAQVTTRNAETLFSI